MRFHVRNLALAGALALAATFAPPEARADGAEPAPAAPAPTPPAPPAPPAPAAPAAEPAPLGKADTARRCVESIIAYALKDDFDSASAFMSEPYKTMMPKVIKTQRTSKAADDKLIAAMDKKFGAGSGASLGIKEKKNKFLAGSYAITEVKEQGDHATVIARETAPENPKRPKEETFECVKTDGFWFASPPSKKGPGGAQMPSEQEAKMVDLMAAAMGQSATETEALAGDVDAGKFAKKEEVKPAYMAIQMKVMQALMGAGMGALPKPGPKGGEKAPAPEGGAKPTEGSAKEPPKTPEAPTAPPPPSPPPPPPEKKDGEK